jgi:hypothetical protein
MSRNKQSATSYAFLATAVLITCLAADSIADPLPGRDLLKFSQKPMINTPVIDVNGVPNTYNGHDELSTAYGGVIAPLYDGRFMADDFADKLSSPVVHVKWWGSYLNFNPQMPVNKFLISFESDAPQTAANQFSHPDKPLLNQVVVRNPLSPGSGTFTEKQLPGTTSIDGPIFEYNAELHLGKDFPEMKDTVYWLKIVAMVDDIPGVTFDHYNPQNSPFPVTQWGWHNRDYTVQDTYASTGLSSPPGGELIAGLVGGGQPVWHFQDDAIRGDVRITPSATGGFLMPNVDQPFANMVPQKYLDGIDGPAGPIPGHNIGSFSKDLAFELYTISIPEPGTFLLLVASCAGLAFVRNRRSRG